MVRSEAGQFDQSDSNSFEQMGRSKRPIYPCQGGTPKRSRFKKGSKKLRQNGKHRRRVRKMDW